MKKTLLLAAFAAVSVASFAQSDITPDPYKFSQRAVGEKLVMQATCDDWNTPPMTTEAIKALATNGAFVSLNAQADVNTGMNATCIVDLGGNVGHVLAVTGADMAKLNEAYKAAGLGEVKNAPEAPVGALQFNMYSDLDKTPEKSILKADFVVNAFCTELTPSTTVWSNFYYMTGYNNVTPTDANSWESNHTYATDFCQYDEDGELITDDDENPFYDPNRWIRFTSYVKTAEITPDDGSTPYFHGVKGKLWTGGDFSKTILFIKEYTFATTELTEDSEEFTGQTKMARTVETWNPDPNKVVEAINTVKAAAKFNVVNGQFVSTEKAEVYTMDGKKVFAGTNTQLTPGAYVAKVNGTSVKFTVK